MNKIKEVLESQGRTQKWVSENLGVSRNTVSLWVKGKDPSVKKLYQIAELLDVEVSELLVERKDVKEI